MEIKKIFNIEDKTVVISGATGFFGKVMVETFDQLGAQVIALARSEKIHYFIKENNLKNTFPYIVDFYNKEALTETLQKICNERNQIDVVINNAYDFSAQTGFNVPDAKLEEISQEIFFKGLESGVYWPFISGQILGQEMIKQGHGSIINISSMYGIVSPDYHLYEGKKVFNPLTYSVSKSAVLGMTRYFASFWGKYGVRCNAVSPGAFPNVSGDSYNSTSDKEMHNRLEKKTLLGRIGVPQDLMGTLILLSSDASTYITGQNFVVDGGWTSI